MNTEEIKKLLLDFANHLNTYKGLEEIRFDFIVIDYINTLTQTDKPND